MGQKSQQDALFFRFFTKKSLLSCPYLFKKNSLKNTLLSCPYKRPFSQKHGALMSFFQIFHEKAPVVMPILGQKNVISVKTTLYYGKKKSVGCSFFQKRPFPKKQTALMPIFCPKNVYSLKNTVLTCNFFFKFVMKNPLLSCPYLVKKTSILTKLYYIMGQKSQQDALFSDFSRKNYCSHAHIMSTNAHSLKHTLLSWPYFVKKTSILSKTMLPCNFFSNFS